MSQYDAAISLPVFPLGTLVKVTQFLTSTFNSWKGEKDSNSHSIPSSSMQICTSPTKLCDSLDRSVSSGHPNIKESQGS